MIRSLLLFSVYISFLGVGMIAPFVCSLGYVWVDALRPQEVSYSILTELPVSMIMAVAALGGYMILDRRSPPRTSAQLILTLLLGVWVTATTSWAEVPDAAWLKWDWAFKTIMFSAFMPFVFRSYVQIESFLMIWIFALGARILPVGVKTFFSGGGYGHDLGLVSGNSLLAEGATLATVSLMCVPLLLYFARHGRIIPRSWLSTVGYLGGVAVAIAAAVGTYERTALIGAAVMGGHLWWHTRRKLAFAVVAVAVLMSVGAITSQRWVDRMSTVRSFETEGSALGRILVWKWTLNYAMHHPLGGGFDTYRIDHVEFPPETEGGQPRPATGIAFHSVYFEMLGEQGWVGLGLFVGLVAATLLSLRSVARATKNRPELAQCRDLSFALQGSLLTLLACGSFIGIAFQPMFYYLFASATSLREYVRRGQKSKS